MNTTNYTFTIKHYFILALCLVFSISGFSQEDETEDESTQTGYSLGSINLPNPSSIVSKYTYDPITDRYIYTESVGGFDINYPIILTPKEFQELVIKENLRTYYQDKISAFDGKKDGDEEAQKNLLPEFYVNSGLFESIFGGNTIELIPQGSVELDLGVLWTKQENPTFSARNPSNFTFDFDQRISLSLLGKVGTRLQVTANYDTESTFDFQNLIKLEYTPTEDEILQKIEVGNVNMPLNSSLITGAQSLFGVKTELQFGKTRVTGVFSEQQSQTQTVVAQGGGTLEEFELFGRDYDENRHFFLAQYFRDTYDDALANYPFLQTNVQITRIEVWATNRNNQTENVRNIVGFQDIGESIRLDPEVNLLSPGARPDNGNNGLDPTSIGGTGSQLTESIRDIATVQSGILVPGFTEGFDYVKLENARKLIQGSDYTLDTQLGYISLNQRLLNDETLAVAFQYTVGSEVFQVGEFANDGVDATEVVEENNNQIINQNLVLKLLKSSITSVEENIWDLMMKNIYDTGAFQISQDDFRLNIFYTEASPLNYITPVEGTPFPDQGANQDPIQETPLLRVFNLDRLNFNNDPQTNGDGFFDFVPGITVIPQNGKIVFTKVEPFGEFLFETLSLAGSENYEDISTYNANQTKYVYDKLYKETKTAALEDSEKNKFQLKGRYQSSGGGEGIPIGAFNVPRGSVRVTAGGRVLVEGVDYTVNYQIGRVQILDEALKASNTPIQVSVENNAVFGQQTRRFMGINIEHQFNENFVLGATYLNLNERPITQKANYNTEPINNSIWGFNGNYSSEVPFLTRLVNKLPNIDTDVPSNISLRGEFAYLSPGAPKRTNLNGEPTAYIDDFEGTQNGIDLLAPLSWFLSSRPLGLYGDFSNDIEGVTNGFDRARLNWYAVDPIFYSAQAPDGISDDDISSVYTRRVFIDEIFPEQDIVQGQTTVINTLDLAYYPEERGPYNFDPQTVDGTINDPTSSWAGISRELTSTDFEQSNVEYIEFWVLDPFLEDNGVPNPGGKITFNLGNISEDVIKDSRKQYENGLPEDGNVSLFPETVYGTVVPQQQALIYTFDTTGQERTNQDVGYDGYDDSEEADPSDPRFSPFGVLEDPANDNYRYYLNTDGDIFDRYKFYNGVEGNSPDTFTDTNRGSTTQPDVEDINRDNTMNTIDSYYEYEIPITQTSLADPNNLLIRDSKTRTVTLPNGSSTEVTWYQFRIPVESFTNTVGGITDFRSIRFARMYLTDFVQPTVLRFATLDLVRSDWRRYQLALDDEAGIENDNTEFSVGNIGLQENDGNYVLPPGVELEELNNNNTIVRQNEQSLVLQVCDLEEDDSRAAFKNIDIDMRQYKRMRMFMHAQPTLETLDDGDLVGFIRMGNDFTENYYQIEVPLKVSSVSTTDPIQVWPEENEIDIDIELLAKIKSLGIAQGQTIAGTDELAFYDVVNGLLDETQREEFSNYSVENTASTKLQRITVKGNPSFGDIRVLMVGLKNGRENGDIAPVCGEAWFNELRLSGLDNEGGWAAVVSMDANLADFANISATGRRSTTGFGTIEQGPNERSREDVKQYDVVTNWNLGQLLPKKWGLQIPFNYAQGEELITPEYDQQFKDLKLQDRIDAAQTSEEEDIIREQSESYTKRQSINFIGVRKNRTGEKKPQFYDVENFTFNYSYNEVDFRDFEIERSLDQNIRTGVNYNYNFAPLKVEPFKENDSIFRSKYWKILKDFNLNLLPTSISFAADYNRQFNKQKFRELDLGGGNIGIDELFRRNYTFDMQYNINYNITDALSLNFTAANNNIVRNYFIDDQLDGEQDPNLDVWDGFFDVGDPNRQSQQLGINYELPLNKIPFLSFLRATYSYIGDFQWQKGSDLFGNIESVSDGQRYNLGNTIQNANTHNINSSLDMNKLYRYLGLVKKPIRGARARRPNAANARPTPTGPDATPKTKAKNNIGTKVLNTAIGLVTSVKRIQINYSENNGTFLPGYLETPGFIGTFKPSFGYTFGSQRDVRQTAASNGWLTLFPEFNQQYTETTNKILDISANVELIKDLKIDLTANRQYARSLTENFSTTDTDGDGFSDVYNTLIRNSFGNFNISTALIRTAFMKSDENTSEAFNDFRSNRITIANRLARARGIDLSNPVNIDAEGFPVGYGKNNQAVLLPAFLSAYNGKKADDISLDAFRDVPIPNWTIKYTGLMNLKWFKKHFKRFSLTHGYRSDYTINQFRTNLDYNPDNPNELDQGGNFKNETLYSNINLSEQFSPLVRFDMEMKNSIKILAELKKDRILSLSFDNNLVTEVQGDEYILGLGYRIKDVRIKSKLAGPRKTIVSDLNMRADVSVRENKTIIRYLDVENNQITSGQTIWSLKYSADYAFSKNLTGIFYFDYNFSEYAISTAFPQTSIRSGITLRYNFGN